MAGSDQQPAVQVQLSVRRGREAIEFYKAAVGAEEIYRFGGTDEHEEVVCQLSAQGAPFWVEDESPAHGWLLGRIDDPYGHRWEIGRPLGAWPPPEPGGT